MKTELLPNLKKIFYFSKRLTAQYKNKKMFANLCYHRDDFYGIEAKWHFYAITHGKEVYDGILGTIKRLPTKASLQNLLSNQIIIPQPLFEWGIKNIHAISFFYTTNDEYLKEEKFLQV